MLTFSGPLDGKRYSVLESAENWPRFQTIRYRSTDRERSLRYYARLRGSGLKSEHREFRTAQQPQSFRAEPALRALALTLQREPPMRKSALFGFMAVGLVGCATDATTTDSTDEFLSRNNGFIPNGVSIPNDNGLSTTISTAGKHGIDLNNEFFQNLGANGRR